MAYPFSETTLTQYIIDPREELLLFQKHYKPHPPYPFVISKLWKENWEQTKKDIIKSLKEWLPMWDKGSLKINPQLHSPSQYMQIQLTLDKGRGCFAKKTIEKGTPLGLYLGAYITGEEADTICATDPLRQNYLMSLCRGVGSKYVVSAYPKGNCLSIINANCTYKEGVGKPKESNVMICPVVIHGIKHVVIVACRDIQRGEELLVDYGKKYWEAHWEVEKNEDSTTYASSSCSSTSFSGLETQSAPQSLLERTPSPPNPGYMNSEHSRLRAPASNPFGIIFQAAAHLEDANTDPDPNQVDHYRRGRLFELATAATNPMASGATPHPNISPHYRYGSQSFNSLPAANGATPFYNNALQPDAKRASLEDSLQNQAPSPHQSSFASSHLPNTLLSEEFNIKCLGCTQTFDAMFLLASHQRKSKCLGAECNKCKKLRVTSKNLAPLANHKC